MIVFSMCGSLPGVERRFVPWWNPIVCRSVSSLLICVVSVSVACRIARSSPVDTTSQIGAEGAQAPSSRDFSSSVLSLPSGRHLTVHVILCRRGPRSERRITPSRSPTRESRHPHSGPYPLHFFNMEREHSTNEPLPSGERGDARSREGNLPTCSAAKVGETLDGARGGAP